MNNYTPNSNKYKETQKELANDEKKIKKVVNGPVVIKKKTGFKKFTDNLIAEDMPKVKNYIIRDVIIPGVKKAVSDIVRNGIDMILYGEADRDRKKTVGSKVSYGRYYEDSSYRQREAAPSYRSAYDYDDISFYNRGDAEFVLSQMEDIIERYGFVKVADLYELVGKSTSNHCANNYGWTDLRTAHVERDRDGYIIKLPKALPID